MASPQGTIRQGLSKNKSLEQDVTLSGFLQTLMLTKSRDPDTRRQAFYTIEKTYKTGRVTDNEPATSVNPATGEVRKTAMSVGSGTVGGYLVPQSLNFSLMQAIVEESFILPRATVVPMSTLEVYLPKIDVETTQPAGTNALLGGINFQWDASTTPSTNPTFRSEILRAWNLIGYSTISNQMLADITPMGEEYLLRLFARAAAWQAEYAFLQGLGSPGTMPGGIVNTVNSGRKLVSRATPFKIQTIDLSNMAATMLPYGWINGIWACHPTALAQLIQLTNYFANDGAELTKGACGTLITRPLFITDKLPPLGTTGDLVFFDPTLYVVGLRQEIVIDVDSFGAPFQTNQTDFRVWLRLGGRPQVTLPITLVDGVTTVSPYVILQ